MRTLCRKHELCIHIFLAAWTVSHHSVVCHAESYKVGHTMWCVMQNPIKLQSSCILNPTKVELTYTQKLLKTVKKMCAENAPK